MHSPIMTSWEMRNMKKQSIINRIQFLKQKQNEIQNLSKPTPMGDISPKLQFATPKPILKRNLTLQMENYNAPQAKNSSNYFTAINRQPQVTQNPSKQNSQALNTDISKKSNGQLTPKRLQSDNSNIAVYSQFLDFSQKSKVSSSKNIADFSISTQQILAKPNQEGLPKS